MFSTSELFKSMSVIALVKLRPSLSYNCITGVIPNLWFISQVLDAANWLCLYGSGITIEASKSDF